MSLIRVDKITGKSGTDSGAPITFSGDVISIDQTGHVIQTKSGSNNTEAYSESTGFVSCNLNCTITPTSASSKIFIICNTSGYSNSGSSQVSYYTIYRDSTDLGLTTHIGYANIYQGSGSGHDLGTNLCISELDSPNTTSAITYGLYARVNTNGYRVYWSMNGSTSNIIVMEIAGWFQKKQMQ